MRKKKIAISRDSFSRDRDSFVNDCLEQMLLLLSHLAEQAWWHQSYKVIRLKLLNQQNIPGQDGQIVLPLPVRWQIIEVNYWTICKYHSFFPSLHAPAEPILLQGELEITK